MNLNMFFDILNNDNMNLVDCKFTKDPDIFEEFHNSVTANISTFCNKFVLSE